jgi:hypothetical protein
MDGKSKAEEIVERVHAMVLSVQDPVELQREIASVVGAAYPIKPRPVFEPYATMPLYRFLSVFKERYCGAIEPTFAQWPVMVETCAEGGLRVRFETERSKK